MPTAAVKRYWDWLEQSQEACPACGRPSECIHHIMHILRQRISKDDWLVVKLCRDCHQTGKISVHGLGGERPFLEETGTDLVALAILNRHNFEVRAR